MTEDNVSDLLHRGADGIRVGPPPMQAMRANTRRARRRRTVLVSVAAAVAVALVMGGATALNGVMQGHEPAAAAGRGPRSDCAEQLPLRGMQRPFTAIMSPKQRHAPGSVRGTTLTGGTIDLRDYAGRVVVINVWGSWCLPCRKQAPALNAAAQELAGEGVAFLGLNVDDDSVEQARAYQRDFKLRYPSIFDPTRKNLSALRAQVSEVYPMTVVIDAQGRVAASSVGELRNRRAIVDLVHEVTK